MFLRVFKVISLSERTKDRFTKIQISPHIEYSDHSRSIRVPCSSPIFIETE